MRLETLAPDRAIARIDARIAGARAHGERAVLATDADGTLWEGDIGIDTFEALLAAKGVREPARPMLAAEARALGIDDGGDGNALAARLYVEFTADRYPEGRAFAMMACAWAGYGEDEMTSIVTRVLADKKLAERVHGSMRTVLGWARARELPVWVVSASPIHAVRVGVALFEIDRARVVAMAPVVKDGVLGAALDGPLVYGPGKIAALERALPRAKIIAAFGDSAFDAAMLREAAVPMLVGPSAKLLEEAQTIPGAAILDLG